MMNVILSTIGTSLLTKQIDWSNEKDWDFKLKNTANQSWQETPEEVQKIIATLKDRAIQKLQQGSIQQIRAASAELNGIYGIYQTDLNQGHSDMHWLIATDTAQGKQTAEIVEKFLQDKGLTAQIYIPKGLSTASTQAFSEGIDALLNWLDHDKPLDGYKQVYFNLVGGFKILQAYLNTIGMFYANELIYIFEGAGSEVITIPRLPLKIDESALESHRLKLALMAAGAWLPQTDLVGLPESLLYCVESERTLSEWGRLVWNRTKQLFLSQELLPFPRLTYHSSFHKDYSSIRDAHQKVKLQEVLAKVSVLLTQHGGDTGCLKGDGGVLYEVYTNRAGIAHFRVTQGLRVSCTSEQGSLLLRHYGSHDYVNDNP
jgi:putative CRISPR-associated protein (TIGR02619 family)